MASFDIHLAVAKRYIAKNHINNENDFYEGTIDPDLNDDKNSSHYTEKKNKNLLIPYLQGKVMLYKFLSENNIDDDYNKGVFLHLITDYLFYNDFFNINYLENVTYEEFIKDLYYSYDCTNEYLKDKYKINLNKFYEKINIGVDREKKKKNINNPSGKNILDFDKLSFFIERVSDINLEKYKDKLLEEKENILPD